MNNETKLYWHFCQVDDEGNLRLGYADGENKSTLGNIVAVGETVRVEGEPILCEHGFHACTELWNALRYAQGSKLSLCRVTLGGTVLHDDNKSVASERTVVSMLDVDATEKLLRDWARWCALQVIHLWDAPDDVRQYLETGDESLRTAAWDAAWAAAWAATRDAAWAATRDAAWAATRDAAWAATWAATRDAAWDAAWAAAWAAAWDAARAAARAAEIEKYVAELEHRALKAMGQGDDGDE